MFIHFPRTGGVVAVFATLGFAVLFPGLVAAACEHFDKVSYCTDPISHQATSNVWGPDNQGPDNATIRLLAESWNAGGSADDRVGVSGFGTFGGGVSAHTNGSFGVYLGISGMNGGVVTARYEADNLALGPFPNSYRPGEVLRITFIAGDAKPTSSLVTNGELNAGNISLWSELGLQANFGASVCFFDCASATVPSIGFSSFDAGLPLPPGTSLADGQLRQLVFDAPVGLNSLVAGPVRTTFFNLFQGQCDQRRIEIPTGSAIAEKAGISGCLGLPEFPVESDVTGPRTLYAARTDKFIDLDLDLDYWASQIRGVPPLGYTKSVGKIAAKATFSVDAADILLNNKLHLEQELRLTTAPQMRVQFPFAIAYRVVGVRDVPVSSGFSDTVVLEHRQSVLFEVPGEEFTVDTTYLLPNTFSNDTDLIYDGALQENILQAEFRAGSSLLGFGFRICAPWGSCWSPGIYSPNIRFPLGPLVSFEQEILNFRDSKIFDNNQPPWMLSFSESAGSSFAIDPAFLPVLQVQGPTAPVPEGSEVTITTTGSSDRDGDDFEYSIEVQQTRRNSPLPTRFALYEATAPVGGPDQSFTFNVGDDGDYLASVRDGDRVLDAEGDFVESALVIERVTWEVFNVAPEVTLSAPMDNVVLNEGQLVSFAMSSSDPGPDGCVFDVDWGEGPAIQRDLSISTSCNVEFLPGTTFSRAFDDNGTFTGSACVTDDEGATDCESLGFTVNNMAPSLTPNFELERTLNPVTGELDFDVFYNVKFFDPGALDSHIVELTYDDDLTVVNLPVSQRVGPSRKPTSGHMGRATTTIRKSYATPGTRTTTLCVTDKDGATDCEAGPVFIAPDVDVSASMTLSPDPVEAGGLVEVLLTVDNAGPDTAENIVATVMLPTDAGAPAVAGAAGTLAQELQPFDQATETVANFGADLAAMGDTLAVRSDDAVYVYQRIGNDWVPHATRVAPADGATPIHVAMSGDEDLIAMFSGFPFNAIYLFQRADGGSPDDTSDDSWTEIEALTMPELSDPTVEALVFDGRKLVAGAPGDDQSTSGQPDYLQAAGAIVVFEEDGNGAWQRSIIYESPRREFGNLGATLAAGDGRIASAVRRIGESRLVKVFDGNNGFGLIQTLDGDDFSGAGDQFASQGLALADDFFVVSSSNQVHGFSFDGMDYVLDNELTLTPARGVGLENGVAAIPVVEGNDFDYVQIVARVDGVWTESGIRASGQPSERAQFGDDAIALVQGTVLAGAINANNPTGAAFALDACKVDSAGIVICAVGALVSGETQSLNIISRLSCGASGTIAASAMVSVEGIDSDLFNNDAADTASVTTQMDPSCDAGPPAINPVLTGTKGDNDWFVSDVDLAWQVSDPDGTAITTNGCIDSTISADTTGSIFACEATSNGVTTTGDVMVRRDVTAPTISPVIAGTEGDNGWYTSVASLTVECTDATSGIASCEPVAAQEFSEEGVYPALLSIAVDNAGNDTELFPTVSVDLTEPSVTFTRTTPNGAGWNNTDVTVTFTCADETSGVAQCPENQVLTTEGTDLSVNVTAIDVAGLETPVNVTDIQIDKTGPVVTSATESPAANSAGWQQSTVAYAFECEDALSGVESCPAPVVFQEGAAQIQSVVALDVAGNETSIDLGPLNIDLTPPQLSATVTPAPNGDGVREMPVTIVFACTDELSGMEICPEDIAVTAGLNQTFEVTATDLAGNSSTLVVKDVNAGVPELSLAVGDLVVGEGETLPSVLANVSVPAMTTGMATIAYGDGYTQELAFDAAVSPAPIIVDYRYADDGVYTVSIGVQPLLGDALSQSFQVTVNNVAPTIDRLAVAPIDRFGAAGQTTANQPVVSEFLFTDAGSADTHLATVDWGDGTIEIDMQTNQSPVGAPSPGSISGSLALTHIYDSAGNFDVSVCVSDDDGSETCDALTVTVVVPAALPAAVCSANIGTPEVSGGQIIVPVTSSVDTGNGETVTGWDWSDADGVFAFADATAENTDVAIPLNGSASYDLAVSVVSSIDFATGQSGYCAAQACAVISSDGTATPCQLESDFTLEVNVQRMDPTTESLNEALDMDITSAEYDVEIRSNLLAEMAQVRLTAKFPNGLEQVVWECGVLGGDPCSTDAGSGTVITQFALPAGMTARLQLSGQIDPDANFVEIDARAEGDMSAPMSMVLRGNHYYIEAYNDGVSKSGFE